jgi:PncC family amidohydrolase
VSDGRVLGVFRRSVIAYSIAAKRELLGVPGEVIDLHGAVSEPVALAMASGIRERSAVDIGVGITGIAGPSGATDDKPLGTVVIAVSGPGAHQRVRTMLFPGDRQQVRTLATHRRSTTCGVRCSRLPDMAGPWRGRHVGARHSGARAPRRGPCAR